MQKQRFKLSCRGHIAAALTLAVMYTPQLWAEGIVPAPGSNTEVKQAKGGTEVVNIVGANEQGLSHNIYTSHNVGRAGAVYNNATTAGQSQLAGQLAANAKLGGRSASVIFNEVISRNPSLLLGQMEVFGKAADLVLANPNGITCNGCGFVNTRRAALLVGTAQIEGGRLQNLSSMGGQQSLNVGPDGLSADHAVDLIAPRINAEGAVVATSGIQAVSGQARVQYDTGEVVASSEAPVERLDSAFLGGMQAGRISIVSTDEGAGVNLSGVIRADERVKVEAKGQLALNAAQMKGSQIDLSAKNIEAAPRVRYEEQSQPQHNESWFIWKTGESKIVDTNFATRIEGNRLEGHDVKMRADGEIRLSATDIVGGDVRLNATEILLNATEGKDGNSRTSHQWQNSWQHNSYTEESRYRQHGVTMSAERNLTLEARDWIDAQGAAFAAKEDVRMTAGRTLELAGVVENTVFVDRGNRYLEGPGLASGDWNNIHEQQSLKRSEVSAGKNLVLNSGSVLSLESAKLQAGGDMTLNSHGQVHIGVQGINKTDIQFDKTKHWGGIGGSDRKNDRSQGVVNIGSEVLAQGMLTVNADQDIRIVGSDVKGVAGARAVTQKGSVQIEQATNLTQSHIDERRGGAFNIQTERHYGDASQQSTHSAQLASNTNLNVVSAEDIDVKGSRLDAKGELGLQAGGNIRVDAAEEGLKRQQENSALNLETYAGWDPRNPNAYRVGIGLAHNSEHVSQEQTTQIGSSVTGGNVRLDAQGNLALRGSQVTAQNGDVVLNGQNLSFEAAYGEKQETQAKGHVGTGIFVAASWEQFRGGLAVDGSLDKTRSAQREAQVSQINASGNVTLQTAAQGTIKTEGTRVHAGGNVSVDAGQMDNHAVLNESSTLRQTGSGGGDIAAVAELGGLLKPVETMANKVKNGQILDALKDAGKLKDSVSQLEEKISKGDWGGVLDMIKQVSTPSVGGLLDVDGQGKISSQSTQTASASRIEGADVRIHSAGALNDQATQYHASRGAVELKANEHRVDAVTTRSESGSDVFSGKVFVEPTTMTGNDLRLKASGNGEWARQRQTDTQATGGEMRGAGGVRIEVGQNGVYQGTQIDAGQGRLDLSAGGEVRMTTAQTTHTTDEFHVKGSLGGNLVILAAEAGGFGVGGSGNMQLELGKNKTNTQDVLAARLSGKEGVSLQSGGDMALSATQIGATGDERMRAVSMKAGGQIEMTGARQAQQQQSWGGEGQVTVAAGTQLPSGSLAVKIEQSDVSHGGSLSSTINAQQVSLESGRDLRLEGAQVSGDQVTAHVGGDLRVASMKDDDRSRQVVVDMGGALPSIGDLLNENNTVRVKANYEQSKLDAATQQSGLVGREKMDLQVAGQTVLEGGKLQSGQGAASTGGPIVAQTLPGQYELNRYSADFNGTMASMFNNVVSDLLSGKAPLGATREQKQEPRPMPSMPTR